MNTFTFTFQILAIVHSMQARMSFDMSSLGDVFERPVLGMDGVRIGPLVKNPGKILLTQTRLYFQAFNNIEPAVSLPTINTAQIAFLIQSSRVITYSQEVGRK